MTGEQESNFRDATHAASVGNVGDRVGAFVLRERIGEGGMGEVWRAEQQTPIRRDVALKVIKQGMDSKQVVARFQAERQALAMMDHPAIAKIYEAGTTDRGKPYFAMEYVKGVPITEHCDRHTLTTRERLELFVQTCDGVQHAHQKAVIHRDLKPSNVLVTLDDQTAHPKIIDFGVAKATGGQLTDETMHTQFGVMIGTPAYMSPEQAEMTSQDVDTRTDVYSLGVILYELLVGATPFTVEELLKVGYEAMVRKIREDEPPRPSTRISTLGDDSTNAAKRRRTEIPALKRELSGDLDWITMKALEKDRRRRYRSPAELAEDVLRYLADEPVEAGSPGTAYRLRKFVRRHRSAVAGVALVVLAGIVAIAGLGIGLRRAVEAERRAVVAEAVARQEAETAHRVTQFLTEMFEVANPGDAVSRDATAREILDAGAARVRTELTDTPLVRARLMGTIGEVYTNLGQYEEAESLLREALAIEEAELGESLPVADTLNNLGVFLAQNGRMADAKPQFERALRIRERLLPEDDLDLAQSMNNLAIAVRRLGDYDAAIPLTERALEIRESVEPESGLVADTVANLGNIYFELGQNEKALSRYERALAMRERINGPSHADVGAASVNLGNVLTQLGEFDRAEASFVRALDVWAETLDPDHPLIGFALTNLAELHAEKKEWIASRDGYTKALEFRERTLPEDHPDLAYPLNGLGRAELRLGNLREAERLLERARVLRQGAVGPTHPDMHHILADYVEVLRALGERDKAERFQRQLDTVELN